ncbi:MAG TPA: tRNA (adenosine(37)-N6)-dimethylallyltransferase MiaA [Gemmatimonadales bacterium]
MEDGSRESAPFPIPVLAGPTGIGKTAVATVLASLAPIEIISADSRQIYRGLDVGTAKPSAADRAAAPYHGIDILEPRERYSAGRFARDAAGWIVAAAGRGRLPVVVGGTGFYLRALFDGLFDEPEMDESRRQRLRSLLDALPGAERVRWARRLDPVFAGGGAQREARGIEVALLTGVPLSRLHQDAPAPLPPAKAWYAVMKLPREQLVERITQRVRSMLSGGLVAEVERSLAAGVPDDAPGLSGVGYAEVVELLRGRLAAASLESAIVTSTRRYAKRQVTWFRHQLKGPVTMLDASQPPDVLAQELLSGYRAAVENP